MNQKVAVSVVNVSASFMAIMDATIVNVALASISKHLHVSTATAATTVIAFLVSFAVFIPASSWLADRFGARIALLGAMGVFTAGSALCGLAGSIGQLDAFRILQGMGGGLMAPIGMTMLFRVFPPSERVRASGLLIIPTGLGPALGPVLGGVLVTELSWRWVFYVNVPIGVAALLFGTLFVADQRPSTVGRFDIPGFVLSGAGLGFVMYGVSEGPQVGWHATQVLACLLSGLMILGLMVVVELRAHQPLLDLRLFTDRLFRSNSGVMVLAGSAFGGMLYLLALFFQDALHRTALEAGLNIFPEAVGVVTGSQIVTRLAYPALGPRRVIIAGLCVVAATALALASVGPATNPWVVRIFVYLLGVGMSGIFMPTQAAAFATVAEDRTGAGSALFNAQRQLSGAVGVALLTTVVALAHPSRSPSGHVSSELAAYHAGFAVAAGVALLAGLVALRISDADAAPTVTRRRTRVSADRAGTGTRPAPRPPSRPQPPPPAPPRPRWPRPECAPGGR